MLYSAVFRAGVFLHLFLSIAIAQFQKTTVNVAIQHGAPPVHQLEQVGRQQIVNHHVQFGQPMVQQPVSRTIHKTERHRTTVRIVPPGCAERTIKKVTMRQRRRVNGVVVEDWETRVEYYDMKASGEMIRISTEEAERCAVPPPPPSPDMPPPDSPEEDEEKEENEEKEERGEIEEKAEKEEEEEEKVEYEGKEIKGADTAKISRIISRPPSTGYLDFSDPQNRGKRWCWKLVFKSTTPHNFGYLVHHNECIKNRNSPFYQETTDASVCTKEGGLEVDYLPFEGSTIPYKIACLSRLEAMKVDADSCWKISRKLPNLVLTRVGADNSACEPKKMPWPFHDNEHVSSRYGADEGGISRLYYCNRPNVTRVSVLYHMTAKGVISGFSDVLCDPPPPLPHYACLGVAVKCFYYHPPDSYFR